MAKKLITPPAIAPVSLAVAKERLRVDVSDEDDKITKLIAANTAYAERFMGRALIDQTWELILDKFPTNEIKIPLPPLIEVVSVKYDDGAGDEQTVSTGSYTVDAVSEPGWVVPASSWPATFDGVNSVRVRFRAGYIDENSPAGHSVPEDIINAILLRVKADYDDNNDSERQRQSAERLLKAHRIELGMA